MRFPPEKFHPPAIRINGLAIERAGSANTHSPAQPTSPMRMARVTWQSDVTATGKGAQPSAYDSHAGTRSAHPRRPPNLAWIVGRNLFRPAVLPERAGLP
jgi:hypothetical protein